ncbi:MAG: MFS transporter [Actinobacteria bacterium]|nr:MFS transporter [Actinomycetota bacterium]
MRLLTHALSQFNKMFGDLRTLRKYPGFTRLISARLISNFGNGFMPIALSFGILALPGGSASDVSLVLGVQLAPTIAFMIFGGVAGDRFKRNQIVGGSDVIGSLFVFLSAASFIFGFTSIALLCITGFIFGVLNAFWWPAFSGMLPEILPKEQLQKGNATVGLLTNFGYVAGSLVAGILVASFGAGWAILIDGISFLIAGVLVWGIDLPSISTSDNEKPPAMWRELREGWSEFISRKWVVVVVIAFSFVNLAYEATLGVLGPIATKEHNGGPKQWSWVIAAITLGMIVGGVLALRVHFSRPLLIGILPEIFVGVWIFMIGVPNQLVATLLVAFATGISLEIFYVAWSTSMQQHIPSESYSRVISYDALGSYALAPIGLVVIGPIIEAIGVVQTSRLLALMTAIAVLTPVTFKEVRSLRNVA